MLRSVNRLVRTLVLGTVVSALVILGAGTLTGCEDELSPEVHIERLKDPVKRVAAITRLIQFYEDAMTKDKKNREGESVKPLLEKIVPPLAELSMSGEVDSDIRTNAKLMSFLADCGDARANPAIVRALENYKPNDKRPDEYDEAMADVVRAVAKNNIKEASKPLLELFVGLHASWPKASNKQFYLLLNESLRIVADPAWESQLIAMIKKPVSSVCPKGSGASCVKALKNEIYWQVTAARLLGKLGSAKAVEPLIKVALSPFKTGVATTAIVALIKIGKPAIDAGVNLLNGTNTDMIKYSEEEFLRFLKDKNGEDYKITDKDKKAAKTAHVGWAAIIVATIGRKEAIPPMLAAIEKGDATTQAIIARELPKLPKTPEVVAAFKKVYEDSKLDATIPPGNYAREVLLEASATFFDKDIAEWIYETSTKGLKGKEEGDTAPIRQKALEILLKLVTEDQIKFVTEIGAIKVNYPKKTTIGKAFEKEIKIVEGSLAKCKGEGAKCWLAKLVEEDSQKRDTQFQGIKAAYMLGILGDESIKPAIIEAMPKVTNAAVRFVVGQVLDHLSPNGDKKIADDLQAIIDKNEASHDTKRIQADAPLKTIVHRLRARAQ